jgi:hypothetical protein
MNTTNPSERLKLTKRNSFEYYFPDETKKNNFNQNRIPFQNESAEENLKKKLLVRQGHTKLKSRHWKSLNTSLVSENISINDQKIVN